MTDRTPESPQRDQPGGDGPTAPVRKPTTSLSAFKDLKSGDAAVETPRSRRWSGSGAATTALVLGLAVLLATLLVGTVGYAAAKTDTGWPIVVGLFVLLAAAAILTIVTAVRAVLSARRTGSGPWLLAVIGAVLAVGSVAILGSLLFTPNPAERAPGNGPIIAAGPLRIGLLLEGDCLTEIPAERYEDPTTTAEVVPCADSHLVEVVALIAYPDGGEGLAELCAEATQGNGRDGAVHVVAPTEAYRANYNSGQLVCLQ